MGTSATIEVRRRTWDAGGGELVDDRVWETRRAAGESLELVGYGEIVVTAVSPERVTIAASGDLELRGDPELALGGRASVSVRSDAAGPHWELRVIALGVDARMLPGGTALERELLAAIVTDPEEDGPRLVYADWLMSQPNDADRKRGELMQVQIALAASPGSERRRALRSRERELLDELPPPNVAPEVTLAWHRGFLERCSAEASAFVRHARELFLIAPMLASLELEFTPCGFDALAHVDGMAQIRELTITPRDGRWVRYYGGVARLVPHLPGLRRLRAPRMHVGGDGAQAIVAGRACPQLSVLDLSENELAPAALAALVASPHLQPRVVRFAKCELDPHDVQVLAGAPWLAEVEELDLGDNAVGDRGALALAAVPFRRLRRLALASCGIEARGFSALVQSRHLARLVHLRVHRNAIGDAGAVALASSRLRSIAELDAQDCEIGDDGIAALAESPNVRAARRWRLGGNRIGDAGARAILESIHLRDLVGLDLSRCPITDEELLARIAQAAT